MAGETDSVSVSLFFTKIYRFFTQSHYIFAKIFTNRICDCYDDDGISDLL